MLSDVVYRQGEAKDQAVSMMANRDWRYDSKERLCCAKHVMANRESHGQNILTKTAYYGADDKKLEMKRKGSSQI